MIYVAGILILLICGMFVFVIGTAAYGILSFVFGSFFKLRLFMSPIPKEWIYVLEKEFDYYNKLPIESQRIFLSKVKYFYHGKNFVPKKGIVISERMKVLVCASAAQLTFGLPLLKLPHFQEILIFPTRYYNKRTKRHHVGEVNTQGVIVLSWEHFQKGYKDAHDGYNLALHELAHALRFEDFYPNEERNFLDQDDINELHQLYNKLGPLIRYQKISFLNKYAGRDFEEFFAVAVESYFERPEQFLQQLPDLYHCMCRILNQDTVQLEQIANKSGNRA